MAPETPEIDILPSYNVIEFSFSENDTDAELSVLYRGTRLHIYLFEENFAESPQLREKYLFYLQVAEEFELDGATVEDFYDWIMEPFIPLLCSLPPPEQSKTPTLQDFFYAKTLTYTLKGAASGERVPSPYKIGHNNLPMETGIRLPALSGTPRKVQVADGSEVFFLKLLHAGDQQRAVQELRSYKRIADAGLAKEDLRTSRLLGLLQDNDGFLLGLLLSYIDCRARNLMCAVKPGLQDGLRRKWADQVTSTVNRLHAAGAIWGDAKAENVLVDIYDNAWVTDFGGGYTEGWVDKDAAGTMEGDLQGLANILKHLGVSDDFAPII